MHTSIPPKEPHEDSQLVGRAKRNKKEFAGIYQKYFTRVHRYVSRRMRGNPETAEDVTQETFVRALRWLPRFQVRGYSYLSYLLRIAGNLVIGHYRKKKTAPFSKGEQELVDQGEDIEKAVSRKFEDAAVQEAMAKLSVAERTLLLLRYQRELSLREIARQTDKSENAVKTALFRARKQLGEKLVEEQKRLGTQNVNRGTGGERG